MQVEELLPPAGEAISEGVFPEAVLDGNPVHPLVEGSPPSPPPEAMADPGTALGDAAIVPAPKWYEPSFWFGPTPWDAGLQLGLNGSRGNNDVLSMRVGGHLNRESSLWKLATSLGYNKNVANDVETQNNAKFDLRIDRNVQGTRWTLFFLENVIYDEYQSFDVQLSLNVGIGYRFLKTETLDFLGRFGAGSTRELGGVDNEWVPQALFGLDYTHQITKMQKLTAKVDVFPEWADFSNYRVVADCGWQIDLDQPKNVSLKASIIDRYDSTPNGSRPNNFDYAILLIWGI